MLKYVYNKIGYFVISKYHDFMKFDAEVKLVQGLVIGKAKFLFLGQGVLTGITFTK
jgi:hypothetical protein